MEIGKTVLMREGHSAFIPDNQLSSKVFEFPQEILVKASKAERLVGKLDGITHILPDSDFFINMYVIKDATNSAQIEGTQATMVDALEMKAGINMESTDANDILFYTKALNYGIKRLKEFPFSLRYIRELHRELMHGARSSHFCDPGEWRKSQNWIGGTSPSNAKYVPPPPNLMLDALSDLEKFIYKQNLIPILQAGIIHAHFETIHPFLDGNGRTGRLLITLFLYEREILEKPVLFLSSYFKKHQQLYYEKLNDYHGNKIYSWLEFYLDGVIETAEQAIEISKKITSLRDNHMQKLHALGKREAESGVKFLQFLFSNPVVNVTATTIAMNFTRTGATRLIQRFVKLGILTPTDESTKYGITYYYNSYISIFND